MATIKTRHISKFAAIALTSPAAAAIRHCTVHFAATQSGSGTPSPSNIRQISGYTGAQLYLGSSMNSATTYTQSWAETPGTVYTGYIDFITGVLTATHYLARCQKTDFGNRSNGTSTGTYYRNSGQVWPSAASGINWSNARSQQICNMGAIANPYSQASTYGNDVAIMYNNTGANGIMRISQTIYQALGDNDYVEILYKLATPLTYNLQAYELNTLIGYNRIWSNRDTVQIDYDLYETCDMVQLRQRFILSAPHIIMVKSGNTWDSDYIAHFNTKFRNKLNAAKVSFIAQQQGAGIPSPTNVRNFTPRNTITLTQAGVNLISTKEFTNGSGDGITYTKHVNSDGEIDYITVTGTPTWANYFRNIGYEANKFKLLEGRFSFNASASNANLVPVGSHSYYNQMNQGPTGLTSTGSHIYYVFNNGATANCARIQGYPYQTGTYVDTTVYPMVSLGIDENQEFEPYKGIQYTVTLPVSSYGGTIDFINGTFTDEYELFTFHTDDVEGYQDWPSWTNAGIKSYVGSGLNTNLFNQLLNVGTMYAANTSGYNDIFVLPRAAYYNLTLDQWKQKNLTIQLLLKRPDPTTYQLTPQSIKTFKGINNIWSKEGKVQISYWDNKSHNYQEPPIILDNYTYNGVNGRYCRELVSDSHFCVLGVFDTGYQTAKSYTIYAEPDHNTGGYMRFRVFNDMSASSIDWGPLVSSTPITWNNISGRYMTATVYKPNIDNFFIYNNTDQCYVYKGKNVT